MEQKSLKVLDTNKTFFSKITTNITKLLIPTKVSFNNIIITIKRNSVIKNYYNYTVENNEEKKEILLKKYEDAYVLYLESIDKYILDSLYKKVKNNTASNFEKTALSKYYTIVSLKEKQYLEYKYKKQEYLLNIDYESLSSQKKENALEKYNDFYVSKMDMLNKGLLKNYSVQLSGNKNEEIAKVYQKIFSTLETYASDILPVKIKLNKTNDMVNVIKRYEEYESASVGKLNEIDKIKQKMTLINLSRLLFTHSLPPIVAEQCYKEIIKQNNLIMLNATNKNKEKTAYNMLIELIENYNYELLSTKIYWDKPEEREEYKIFQEEYRNLKNIISTEREKEKEILFLKSYIKYLRKNNIKSEELISKFKQKLTEFGVIKTIKNSYKSEGAYVKKEWKFQK
ncbi:MAG: hypothetical protein E7310_00805 [Clostridiales bacterium]|nr:hypothetical protein [Clostridiales bacterium]